MKKVIVKLLQLDSDSYRVLSPLVNTAELTIGQIVERDRVRAWTTQKQVTVIITDQSDEEQQQTLLGDAPKAKRAPKSKQLPAATLSIAK